MNNELRPYHDELFIDEENNIAYGWFDCGDDEVYIMAADCKTNELIGELHIKQDDSWPYKISVDEGYDEKGVHDGLLNALVNVMNDPIYELDMVLECPHGEHVLTIKGVSVYSDDTSENFIAVFDKNNEIVGELELVPDDEYDAIWLHHIEVNEDCRRQGVATALVKAALDKSPQFHVPDVLDSNYEHYLTLNGKALVEGLQKKGVLKDEHLRKKVPKEGGYDNSYNMRRDF